MEFAACLDRGLDLGIDLATCLCSWSLSGHGLDFLNNQRRRRRQIHFSSTAVSSLNYKVLEIVLLQNRYYRAL